MSYAYSMEKNELYSALLSQAAMLADELYGCDLSRLDPDELAWYAKVLTEENFKAAVADLADAAWQAY
jgi:hypothetical protein